MIDKLKRIIKNNKWLFITLLMSNFIIAIIYMINKIKPFGNNSMLDVDFYHQYGPLLNELYDRVKDGSSLLYSFNTAGGMPFYRNFLNYLSSPFNIIMFLFKKENIVMSFSIIIGIKVIFSSISMYYYLSKTFKKKNILLPIFSCLYAFSGYFCAYYWNIMWLDGMVFLPLIMYGINKIIDEEKPVFYAVWLSIMLFSNYFIGYMICIFACFYFAGYFWYKNNFKLKNIVKKGLLFVFFSILAAGLVSFALIPLAYSISSISATGDAFPSMDFSFSILDYLFNHITGVERTVFASDTLPLPNIYAGLLTLVFIVAFFINKKINKRAKILSTIALVFFFLCFNITSIDFIWHAFHVPNDLPWRYSFLYVFILIIIGYYSCLKIKYLSKIKLSICFGIIIIFCLLSSKLSFKNLNDVRIIVCIIFLLCYYLLYILSTSKKFPRKLTYVLILFLVSIECIYGICANWQIDHDITTFMSDKPTYQTLIKNTIKDDNGLYRIEKTNYLTLNDPAWYDYKGITTFSSMNYEDVSKFQRKMGLSGNDINSFYYQYYQTPIYNTMFNVKYIMGNYIENDYYVSISSEDDKNLIGYNYSSSIAYALNNELKNWQLVTENPFLNQSNFVSLGTNVNDVYEKINIDSIKDATILNYEYVKDIGEFNYEVLNENSSFTIYLNNEKEQNVYLYIADSNISSFEVDGSYYSINSDEYYTVDVGKKQKGKIEVKINLKEGTQGFIKFKAYSINDNNFKNFYNKLKEGFLNVKKYSDTLIYGDINVQEDQFVFTTIAYDLGWNVYVDGKKVDTYKVADSYLGFDVEEGKHKIEIKYYPPKMKLGVIISFISLVLIVIYYVFIEEEKYKNNKKDKFNV